MWPSFFFYGDVMPWKKTTYWKRVLAHVSRHTPRVKSKPWELAAASHISSTFRKQERFLAHLETAFSTFYSPDSRTKEMVPPTIKRGLLMSVNCRQT